MEDTSQSSTRDYTTGKPRKHHSLYLEDGNFVIRVENAIFKILRSLLAGYSTVIRDMLNVPNGNESVDGTDERPLVLTGDTAAGWELLLGLQYDSSRINPERLNGKQMLLVLPIAHKYGIEDVEADALEVLKDASNNDGYVDLMVASRIVGSDVLYQDALQRLISSTSRLDLEQAKRIGVEATHAVTMAGPQHCANCGYAQ